MGSSVIRRVVGQVSGSGVRIVGALALSTLFAVTACSSETDDVGSTESGVASTPAPITLHVVDQGTQHGLEAIEIAVLDSKGRVVANGTTNAAGSFVLKFPSQGTYTVTAAHRGYSLGITGFDTKTPPNGEVFLPIGTLESVISDSQSRPGTADVEKEIGRSLIDVAGSSKTTLFAFQGPRSDDPRYEVPLFGATNTTYELVELDAATLKPLGTEPKSVTTDETGLFGYTLSAAGIAAIGGNGVLVAMTLDSSAPSLPGAGGAPGLATRDVPIGLGQQVGVNPAGNDSCGPPGATCLEFTQSTGNVQTFCPPATNSPYCTVSFTASISVTISGTPGGVGIAVQGTIGAGAASSVYPTGTGTFECKVVGKACTWTQPGHWVARQGWRWHYSILLGPYLSYDVYNVWVSDPCAPGGLQYPNMGINNGQCTCFNWSATMEKIRECPAVECDDKKGGIGPKNVACATVEQARAE